MFRPQIQKTRVLAVLALTSLLMVYVSSNSTVTDTALGYEYKFGLIISQISRKLRSFFANSGYNVTIS